MTATGSRDAAARLLDLFCGAGGCSVGYQRAGFDVTGVDIKPHPDYPFEFRQADAMDVLADAGLLKGFDVVHASPPCQGFTSMSNRWRGAGGKADCWPDLISAVRDALRTWGGVYVIENVPGARSSMLNPVLLSGAHFGLGVHRPRLFDSNVLLLTPSPPPRSPHLVIGVYGDRPDGRRLNTRADGQIQRAAASLAEGQAAMGIDWMTDWRDLCEAIPPAYTEFLGHQLAAHVASRPAYLTPQESP